MGVPDRASAMGRIAPCELAREAAHRGDHEGVTLPRAVQGGLELVALGC